MAFEKLIEEATGLPTADTAFARPQKLPFVIFIDRPTTDGDDFNKRIIEHDLAVEFYAERIDRTNEAKLEELFDKMNWRWTRNREYLPKPEDCFVTVYEFQSIFEKCGKET